MSIMRLLLREIRHRKLSFLLGLLAITATVALFVALMTMGQASNRETKRLMRNLGFNMLILPQEADLADYWAADCSKADMPEEYVQRLAGTPGISADHYVATLAKRVKWKSHTVVLTGVLPERTAIDARKKTPMGYDIPRGSCYVGYTLAHDLGIQRKDTIDLLGKEIVVKRVLLQAGSKDDIRIYAHLHDVQEILEMPGRINAIQVLQCLCVGDSFAALKQQVSAVLPDTYAIQLRDIAVARSATRQMVEEHVGFILAVVLGICAAWIGLLSLLNVQRRRQEIGILHALGFSSSRIAALFLGRAALVGLVGAMVGFVGGTALALHVGPEIFQLTYSNIRPAYDLFVPVAFATPLFAMLASFLPAMAAVTQDPATVLREE